MSSKLDKVAAYPCSGGGAVTEDTAYGFNLIVHYPADLSILRKRVAQVHADAVITKVKGLNCSAEQKKALIESLIT
ncbi:hypothetical protein CE91St41_26850 [Oscillospiraceae bacterium]|nr:hypothetical protein CE91St40_10690 [Oscillospiraceae bacterium]BDF75796.1 hypothetical protein CE91St41_26850 [Oscillospiraceae bacterium]